MRLTVVGFVLAVLVANPPARSSAQELAVHFMNVGQGDGTLIVCPNGNRILVDAGSSGGGTRRPSASTSTPTSRPLSRRSIRS